MNSRLELGTQLTQKIHAVEERRRARLKEIDELDVTIKELKALRREVMRHDEHRMDATTVAALLIVSRLRQADIADRGTVRLGDSCITAEFPAWCGVVAELPPECK